MIGGRVNSQAKSLFESLMSLGQYLALLKIVFKLYIFTH